jgi:hypothetical protein
MECWIHCMYLFAEAKYPTFENWQRYLFCLAQSMPTARYVVIGRRFAPAR